MIELGCIAEGKISKTERCFLVGYRPNGGDRSTPQMNFGGKWLTGLGFEVGTGVSMKMPGDCLLLIPDSREETRLWRLEEKLNRERAELEQARVKMMAALA